MEKILEIKEVLGIKYNHSTMEGYEVVTDKQKIQVLISDGQDCCEDAGYMSSFEDPSEFIGGELLKVEVVDTAHNKKKWDNRHPYGFLNDGGGAEFVNFETNKGLFQLAVYNSHNGHYGHSILIKGAGLDMDSSL